MFGHCQPMPMSEVAFPSTERKLRNARRSWGVLLPAPSGFEAALNICLKSFGTRLVYYLHYWVDRILLFTDLEFTCTQELRVQLLKEQLPKLRFLSVVADGVTGG